VYGLPELFAEEIRDASLVANPGCFPTPVVLGLAPLIRAGLVETDRVLVDGKTGVSGAGKASDATGYAATEESVRPYRVPNHQHTPEMERVLEMASDLTACLFEAYAQAPFVRVLEAGAMVDAKRTRGSNLVELQAVADPRTSTAVVVGTLDNLVKGAAGQAIQNFNLMGGHDETLGLSAAGMYP
jgi:N-acetyl-gamma-glutamyl-phosphate reductase